MSAMAKTAWRNATYFSAFVHRHHPCSFCMRLFAYGDTNMDPHLLWKQTLPLSSSGLRQEA
jgi:hypothetical protein